MARWNMGEDGAAEDFAELLKEDSDVSDEEVEYFEYIEADNVDMKYFEGAEEYKMDPLSDTDELYPARLLGMYDETGAELLMDVPSRPASADIKSPPSSPRKASVSSMSDVIIRLDKGEEPDQADNDITMEDGGYHLADEHVLYQGTSSGAGPQPVQGERGGGAARRRRGRGRIGVNGRMNDARWVRRDRLNELYVNDDDVPEELRVMVKSVMDAREAARLREIARARRLRMGDDEVDADDDDAEMLLVGEGNSARFEWSSMETYEGKREQFLPQKTGSVVPSGNAYEAFRQYWDDGILSHIVTATNRQAAEIARSSASFAKNWYDTNIHEILLLFSFWMMLGIIRMPSTKSCFSNNPLLQTNIFRKMFSRNRYGNICRALHFADNTKRTTDNNNPLFCLGPVLDHLNSRFQRSYIPSQNICIDESLTLWKGQLSIRQCLKTNASRFGVKTFELCESATGYLWSFLVYSGSHTAYDPAFPSNIHKTTSAVLTLIRPLLNKGYTLFMNNWFNSPLLARYLKTHKTDCVGTLRPNQRNVPPLMALAKLNEGEFIARHSGDMTVLAYADRKQTVTTLSTYHGNAQGIMEAKPHRPGQYKPQVILDFNRGMGGVDRKDQMLEPYLLERKKCAKWNRKVFKRLLNCSILNARILHSSSGTFKEHIVFRLELVGFLLEHHLQRVPKPPSHRYVAPSGVLSTRSRRPTQPNPYHLPIINPPMEPSGRRSRRRCVLCSKRGERRTTSYICCECNVPLCMDPCFRLYHISGRT